MNKIAIAAAAALALATFGTAALAQDTSTSAFDRVDANNDGYVDMAEAQGEYPTLTADIFAQADANSDQQLDEAEFTALVGLSAGLEDINSTSSSSSVAP